MDYESFTRPDNTFTFTYHLVIIVITCIAFFNMLEGILKKKHGDEYKLTINKFVLFLDIVLLLIATFSVVYYLRKYAVLKFIPELQFKMFMVVFDTIIIGIMGIIYYIANEK